MAENYLTMHIHYNIKENTFTIDGNVNEQGHLEIIEAFLRCQIGVGQDTSEPVRKDEYTISLQWYPENDKIKVQSDTGNDALRDGILLYVLKDLSEKQSL